MVLITDPDNLNQATEVTINTTAKTITLNLAGNLSADGVTGQALYSFLKEEWKNDTALIKFPFPMEAITPEQFEFIQDWEPANDATRKLIRTAGWAEKTTAGVTKREYTGIVSLGTLGSSDQPYYNQSGTAVPFTYTGPVNESIQIYGDSTHGNFNYRSTLSVYAREEAKTYAASNLSAIGVTSMTYIVYRFPLSNAVDLKVTESDVTVDAYGVTITYYATPQSKTIGSSNYDFHVIIDGNGKTSYEIYMAVQSALRKATDIDAGAGSKIGKLADELLVFVGDTLKTKIVTEGGVFIEDFDANYTNSIVFVDDLGAELTYPFVATGNLVFNTNLVSDGAAIYKMFFTTNPTGDYGTANAVIVNDNSATPITGTISGSTVPFTFDYDGNVQGGRTAGTNAAVTVVAIGLTTGQFVSQTATITRTTGQNVSLVAALERNYSNL